MSSRLTLAGICLLAAFGLAACGGGGGGTTASAPPAATEPESTEPTAEELAEMAEQAQNAATAAALGAREQGEAAVAASGVAVENATKYTAMITAVPVKGESMTAQMNAQMVLDIRDGLMTAIDDAKAAVQAAEDAKADVEGNDEAIASLDAAIEAAEADIKAAEAVLAGAPLKTQVDMVTGTKASEGNKYPRDAAYRGELVAEAVSAALGERITPRTAAPMAAADITNSVSDDDHAGMTWAAIVGDVKKMRIATATDDTDEVDVASIAGMAMTVITDTNDVPAAGGKAPDGAQYGGTYKAIPGTVICAGSDCAVDDGKLKGSWYFTPEFPKRYYVAATGGDYMRETMYATYGYWLTVSDDDVTVNSFAAAGADTDTNTASLALGLPGPTGDDTREATYSGKALGVSSHWQTDEDDVQTGIQSGQFTADVNLTANFGTAARIGGEVTNFDGAATDARWKVTLGATDLTTDAALVTGAVSAQGDAGEDPGNWTAQGYGEANKRPAGFFGTFNANFTDGRAAGGYATQRD